MIRVTVEIVPYGDESRTRTIGMMHIARTTMYENPETYNCRSYKADGELDQQFQVTDHHYGDGAWELVRRATENLVIPELRS